MKSFRTDNMNGQQKLCVLVLSIAAVVGSTASMKESRTGGLHIPEKIIGGVIDMVQSHKNKPVAGTQPNYPPNQNFNYQQYPQYQQQWNGQSNFQNQGFQTQGPPANPPQGQYSNQGQYSYQNGYNQAGNMQQGGGNIPQSGGNYNPTYPTGSGQSFTQGQNQQGQYQVVYQNPSQFQPNNQFQNSQNGYYTQSQNNQFQSSSSGSQGQVGQTQGQANGGHFNQGFMTPGGQTGNGNTGSGQFSQGFLTTGGQPANNNGQGPTCVCQAWTKPQQNREIFADTPVTESTEKKEESSNQLS